MEKFLVLKTWINRFQSKLFFEPGMNLREYGFLEFYQFYFFPRIIEFS
jgi:hypothetical protein